MSRGSAPTAWTLPLLVEQLASAPAGHGLTWIGADGRRRRRTWRVLHAEGRRLAFSWLAAGLRPGERVLLCLTQDHAVLVAFLAAVRLGCVPCLVPAAPAGQDPSARAETLRTLAEAGQAAWVLEQPETRALGTHGARRLPLRPPRTCPPRSRANLPPADASDPAALAVVQFSSGSTSRPKGVCLTHRNLAANVALVIAAGPRQRGDALATWVPLSHDMGFVGTWLTSLQVQPREHVLLDPWRFMLRPALWLQELARTRARVSACPAFALEHVLRRLPTRRAPAAPLRLERLESLLVGAEPVDAATVWRFEEALRPHGLRPGTVRPVYGLAEATLIVTAHAARRGLITRRIEGRETVSVGRPLGDFRLRVRGGDGRLLPAGQVGAVEVSGASVMAGYLGRRPRAAGGWLATGDLGMLDERGRLYVTGRLKDLMIVDGRNYYPRDVAHALRDVPYLKPGRVHAFASAGRPRPRIVVLTVPRGRTAPTSGRRRAIKARVLARCGLAVDDVVFVPRLPRTSSGKVQRQECERLASSQLESAAR